MSEITVSSCEDDPICFYLSIDEGVNPCRWYVLRSESDDDRELATGSFGDAEEGESPITLTIERQYFFGDTENERRGRKSCKLTELPKWKFPTSLPCDYYEDYKVFAFNSRIYLMGGMFTKPPFRWYAYNFVKVVHYFDTRFPEQGWKKEPDLLETRPCLSAVESSGKIYVMGSDQLCFGEFLDPISNQWRALAPLPSCLDDVGNVQAVAVLEFGRKILLYSSTSQQLFYYDVVGNDWSVLADNFGLWEGRLTVALDCVFCFGQRNGHRDCFSLSAFNLRTRSWLPVEGLEWDGHMMPPTTSWSESTMSSDLFHINHNKLAFVWTMDLPWDESGRHRSLHCSKFFIDKTPTCIRAHPDFCLSAHVRTSEMVAFWPLTGSCFGSGDMDYYEQEKAARELMSEIKGRGNTVIGEEEKEARELTSEIKGPENTVIGDTVNVKEKESWKTVLMREAICRQHVSSGMSADDNSTSRYTRRRRITASARLERDKEWEEQARIQQEMEQARIQQVVEQARVQLYEESSHIQQEEQVHIQQEEQAYTRMLQYPGGPTDLSLIPSYPTHVAARIWESDTDRDPLRCINHGARMNGWEIPEGATIFRDIIRDSSLLSLSSCSYDSANKTLISAFVERWQPDTNTFHLPFGEMTITIEDVSTLLHIPVTGFALSASEMSFVEARALVCRALGQTRQQVDQEIGSGYGNSLRLVWLQDLFRTVSDSWPRPRIDIAARAYLLYMLGSTLFCDKSATRVPIHYLIHLENLDLVRVYSWGSAALAYLYRQLGLASRADVRQIAGYCTLLEGWIYEHFTALRPSSNPLYTGTYPRVSRWTPTSSSGGGISQVRATRAYLDQVTVQQVTFDPYRDGQGSRPIENLNFYVGCLRCYEVIEPYFPERVLRQFGRVQTVPRPSMKPDPKTRRGASAQRYHVFYPFLDEMWNDWECHVLSEARRSFPMSVQSGHCVPEYLEWYIPLTHPRVQNPAFVASTSSYLPSHSAKTATYEQLESVVQYAHRRLRRFTDAGVEYWLSLGPDAVPEFYTAIDEVVDMFEELDT